MNVSDLAIGDLAALVGRPIADNMVVPALGPFLSRIAREPWGSSVTFPEEGIEIMLEAADGKPAPHDAADALVISAIHLHRGGHEEHSGYPGMLPNGVMLDDPEADIRRKMGRPARTGGGGVSSVPPKNPIPRWLKYWIGGVIFHFQLDQSGRLEMVTLMTEDPQLS